MRARLVEATFAAAAVLALETACAPAPPHAANALTIGIFDAPHGLDPAEHPGGATRAIASQIFETLVRAPAGTPAVLPGIAIAWSVASDGLTWTFALRAGDRFSDGTPLDAQAVKLNLDRWRDSQDPNRDALDFPAYVTTFGGYDASSAIDVVTVVSPTSLVIHTRAPFAPLLRDLAQPEFGIGSPNAFRNDFKLFDDVPIGSGPYAIADEFAGEYVTLAANPAYAGPAAAPPNMVFRMIPDPPTSVLSLEKADVDAVLDLPPDVAADVATRPGMHVLHAPSDAICLLAFDVAHPPFDDPRMRRAAAEALDRRAIAALWSDPAIAPAAGWIPAGALGADTTLRSLHTDVVAARAALAPATAMSIVVAYPRASPALPFPDRVATEIAAELRGAGLSVTTALVVGDAASAALPAAVTLRVVPFASGDPDEAYAALAATWPDAAIREMLDRGRATFNDDARSTAYRSVAALATREMYAVPLVDARPIVATGIGFTGTSSTLIPRER